jgi:uncharacterized protein (TIGR03118 family)
VTETATAGSRADRARSRSFFTATVADEGHGLFGLITEDQQSDFSGQIFVTYAKINRSSPNDDLAGAGFGFVDVFNTKGQFLRRLVSQGRLNAPWGLEIVNGALWVGNFGDGRINAYNPSTGSFVGTPRDVFGIPLEFDGLWGLVLTNGGLFFNAGIADEDHGMFGVIFSN